MIDKLLVSHVGKAMRTRQIGMWVQLPSLLVFVCLSFVSCNLFDDELNTGSASDTDVAVHLLFVDTDLSSQSIVSQDSGIQVAQWQVESAILDFENGSVDLLPGQPCNFIDTVMNAPTVDGSCESVLILDVSSGSLSSMLRLELSMQVLRAFPLFLPPQGDFDGDGWLNASDNCLLIFNPNQLDSNGDGFGDNCTLLDPNLGALPDSDGDGVVDAIDNCVWISNPNQEDNSDGMSNGIGDACFKQEAQVQLAGEFSFSLTLGPTFLPLEPGGRGFLVVDFGSSDSLDCDWNAGVCELDPLELTYCLITDVSQTESGCRLS